MNIKIRVFIFFLIIIILSGCLRNNISDINNGASQEQGGITEKNDNESEATIDSDDLYEQIAEQLSEGKLILHFKDTSEDDVIKAYGLVYSDHPEFFWIGDGYSYETTVSGSDKEISFECDHFPTEGLNDKRKQFESKVASIVNETEKLKTDYEKVLFIHDYIIDNTEYDSETSVIVFKRGNTLYESQTAYGCLINRKAICSGYAAAFQLLAKKAGIPCGRVSGKDKSGGDHEWNYIILDGEYYYVDVTWDDPLSADSDKENKTYEYFCITSGELSETHKINGNQFIPECTSKKYDYYVYNNLYVEKYDFNSFSELFQNATGKRKEFKFSDGQELQNAVSDLFKSEKIFMIAPDKAGYSYNISSSGKVLTIEMK